MKIYSRLASLAKTRRGSVLTLFVLLLATVSWVHILQDASGSSPLSRSKVISHHPKTGVKLQASLSHSMIVQGGDPSVYLDLSISAPEASRRSARKPTDVIVVLDRSSSMGGENKWGYATQSVRTLLDRLSPSDRVALVTFDSSARVEAQLTWAKPHEISRLHALLNRLGPRGNTNMGDALLTSERMAGAFRSSDRSMRVMLLSDGHANTGIVEPDALAEIVRRLSGHGVVVSTVGLGLGFNENLMASLADHGMGSFSYLEHLESLEAILVRELQDARRTFADRSEVRLPLPRGVTIADASGYPFSVDDTTASISTGRLLEGVTKSFMLTLKVPNDRLEEYPLGQIGLRYRVDGRAFLQETDSEGLLINCVAPERKQEALESIDKAVFEDAWIRNNLGVVVRQVGDLVRIGDKERAEQALKAYRSAVEEADGAVPGIKKKAEGRLREFEKRVDDAFQGKDQRLKQNRTAKRFLHSSNAAQRTATAPDRRDQKPPAQDQPNIP